tara:strand:+ start:4772 stop:6184 length:1413 start_codon:yes stop_codon:yes gene_type:complete
MIIPFVGGSYDMEAISFDSQRSINLEVIVSESGTSKSRAALRSVAGLSLFANVGGGPIRGGIESDGRAFFVSGNELYELHEDGTTIDRGTLLSFTELVTIKENPTQLMIIDDNYGYIFNKTLNTFEQITDEDFPAPSSLTFQDGYFMVSEKDTGMFYISGINNGLTWDALDFTNVEGSPDKLVAINSNRSNIWAFGTKVTEIYQNTGNAVFPFQKILGATVETGCIGAKTIANLDNSVFWVGSDENGDSIVWRSNGYNAQRISTRAIERKISQSDKVSESYAWVYHERGYPYYFLQIKGLDTTLVYNLSTQLWHERPYRNPLTNTFEQHRGACHVFFDQKHLVGDRGNNKVYVMSLDNYSDDGDPMIKERTCPHIDEERRLVTHSQFELDMEVGVGLNDGQGKEPKVMMQYSDDGGHTWSDELWRDIGAMGKYKTRVKWNRLGRSRDRVYRVKVSDPVFVQINEAYINGN